VNISGAYHHILPIGVYRRLILFPFIIHYSTFIILSPILPHMNNVFAIIACILWSTAFVGVKYTLNYMSPLMLAGLRFMLSGMLLLPFCGGISVLKETITKHTRTVILVSIFQSVLLYGSFTLAMQYVGGAIAAIVVGSSPLISALVAHIMMKDDKMNLRNSFAILLGITGVIIVALNCKPWIPVGRSEFYGILIILFASTVSSIGNVIVARNKETVNAIALNCSQIFLGGVCLATMGLIRNGVPSFDLPLMFYATLLWLAAVSAIAFSLWFHLLTKVKVSQLNIWKFLIPVFGAITSWLILPDESPSLWPIIGLLFVVTGILTANVREKKRGKVSSKQ
jgi:drug/metabolite transporter (DMT)-like permease